MKATTSHIMMIRPVRFDFNVQTAESNSFQNINAKTDAQSTQNQALAE
ncbi:MAG: amidinotransferase, partial [Bacteroidetes bacterium]